MTRKLVLLLALVAAVGFGFGWIAEDLCCLGGSYADDPNTPVAAAEFAIPSHSQAAQKAVLPTVTIDAASANVVRITDFKSAPQEGPSRLKSLEDPRRC